MKREVIFIFAFVFFLVSASFIYASPEEQVANAYSCLESRINATGCSAIPFEDRVFSALADGKCMLEVSKDNSTTSTFVCWPKSGCTLKSTAQAILALNQRVNTTKAEDWLLSRTGIPDQIDWFLEIEADGVTNCNITYYDASNKPVYNKIIIGEDKKVHSNVASLLSVSSNGYWLKIVPSLYNKDISTQCNNSFITTTLFMKKDSSTVHVSSITTGSESNGYTTEKVKSLCFKDGNGCNYEGSLWASLVLYSLGYDTGDFMPYLITMMDDSDNQRILSESFIYMMTGKFRTELLLKQRAKSYWEVSGNRYSDTALALWPFPPDSYDVPTERSNSITWLLSDQQRSGCWNNNNIGDTAFLLYSVWPKGISDCPIIGCKIASQSLDGSCSYKYTECASNDDCCNPGCAYAQDNDCPDTSCTNDDKCSESDHTDGPYCSDDGKSVYEEVYTNTCGTTGTCVENVKKNTLNQCSSTETCESGECVTTPPEDCVPSCTSDQTCVAGECVQNEDTCGALNLWSCQDGKHCESGFCLTNTCEQDGCPNPDNEKCVNGECITQTCDDIGCPTDGQICIAGECVDEGCTSVANCSVKDCQVASCDDAGSCLYKPVGCSNDDLCCGVGCNDTNDDYCPPGPECTANANCSGHNYIYGPYCSDDLKKVYSDFYNYTCVSQSCESNPTTKLIETCKSTEECHDGECAGIDVPVNTSCTTYFDCNIDEDCVAGECVPYDCTSNGECSSGNCSAGYCVPTVTLDCVDEGYTCTSSVNCENSAGTPLDNYFCSGALSVCCNTQPASKSCVEGQGGIICTADQECTDGVVEPASDTMSDETCCTVGTCEAKTAALVYCTDKDGTCTSSCSSNEDEKSYVCDNAGDVCCVAKTTSSPSKLWILIVIFVLLIGIAVVGIVFRDKLRVQWIKLKDKLGGKKEKKKLDMPMTTYPNMNPQGRILPRRIFPPGQQPIQSQQRTPQQPGQGTQLRRPIQPPQGKGPLINKKPEDKPKNELDDVLKKLKEMGK